MSSPALGDPVPPLVGRASTPIKPPIAPSGQGTAKESGSAGLPGEVVLDSPPLVINQSPAEATGAVSELLQRALSLKEGNDADETKDGERTPGTHSRASTDLTAVEQTRISPANSCASRPEEGPAAAPPPRPPPSRTNSLASTNADPPRLRQSNSRRGSNRPYPTKHYHSNQQQQQSQQRISPPQGWHGVSPTSSSDGNSYSAHGQLFYPPHLQHQPSSGNVATVAAAGATNGGGGYGFATTTPPFLAHLPRHPSQISQISDHSAGYSTGSPYSSSSSSLWYTHYASTVTTPSSYPAPLEGGLGFPNDPSPESIADCPPGVYSQYDAMQGGFVPGPEYSEPPNAISPAGPYQAVYFAPPPQRMVYAPSATTQPSPDVYSTAPLSSTPIVAPRQHSQNGPFAYPITSARPSNPVYPEDGGAAAAAASGSYQRQWRGGRQQQTLVPTQQYNYTSYPSQTQYQNAVDPRRFPQQFPPPNLAPTPQAGLVQYPHPVPNTRQYPVAPPAIPPRPQVPAQFPTMSVAQPLPPASPPKIYAPPVEIARGVLASNRLREAAQPSKTTRPVRATRNDTGARSAPGPRKGNLPKPPAHSPHALWVGNVPSDASHSELWQFFVSRPPPCAVGLLSKKDIDLTSPGVESIHLIARSNCAFVNYLSDLHLQHAISISNGLSLRPNDPRCKPLLCRVRKEDDDSKTGVGAQRVGGIHKAFVKLQQERMSESEMILRNKINEEGAEPKSAATKAFEQRRQSSSSASVGTTSTTSSFLTKHFEKRWFIMKSHDEADLKLSVESGLWATQPHNEPVLQQAFRTAKEVFLVFSANGSGEWFGYARMSGPISSVSSSKSSRPSWGSSGQASVESISSASLSVPSQTIQEDTDEPSSFPPRAPVLFSPSEHRLAQASPSMITPSTAAETRQDGSDRRHGGSYPLRLPSEIDAEARREMALEQERMAFVTSSNLHLPPEVAEAARKAATYDSGAKKAHILGEQVPPGSLRDAIRQVDMATGEESVVKPEERDDARKPARSGSSSTWGTPFSIEWVRVTRLPFTRTRHIRNSFNGNREIKVSRDGTEVEPAAGQALIDEFDRPFESPELRTSPTQPSLPRRP